jgi:hypothetical protein
VTSEAIVKSPPAGPRVKLGTVAERWQSGRSRPPRKREYLYGYREFESPPLRHRSISPPSVVNTLPLSCKNATIRFAAIAGLLALFQRLRTPNSPHKLSIAAAPTCNSPSPKAPANSTSSIRGPNSPSTTVLPAISTPRSATARPSTCSFRPTSSIRAGARRARPQRLRFRLCRRQNSSLGAGVFEARSGHRLCATRRSAASPSPIRSTRPTAAPPKPRYAAWASTIASRRNSCWAKNISQTLQFVQSGAADTGIVALSLAVAPNVREQGRYWEVPRECVSENGARGRDSERFTGGARISRLAARRPSGRSLLKQYGFFLPGE